MTLHRKKALLGVAYLVMGVVALWVAWASSGDPLNVSADWQSWSAFAVATVVLAGRASEVNDRLLASSSVMVVFAAGAFLWSRSGLQGEPRSAVPAVATLTAIGFFSPGDLRQRLASRAAINFGQLAVTGLAAGVAMDAVASATRSWLTPTSTVLPSIGDLYEAVPVVAGAGAGAIAYTIVNFVAVRFTVHRLYGRTSLVPWSHIGSILTMQTGQCLIGGALGYVLAVAPSIALVPMVLAMFVIGNLAYSAQATLRSTHEAMLKGFVKILETRDLYTRGHTERVAEFALAIGRELGYSDTQLARLRWAALIHDVGKLAVPTAIMRKQGVLTEEEFHEMRVATHRVDDLLSEVEFLAPMVMICSGVHPKLDVDEDFGQTGHTHSLRATREQSVLAVADAFDAMTSTRSYRMAMNQRTALGRLTATEDPLFHPEVLAALGSALSKMPGSYGPPDLASNTEVLRA